MGGFLKYVDVFSHGLWAGALAKIVNFKKERKINVWLTAFWGVFPDVFAFAPMFIWMILNLIFGNFNFSEFHKPDNMEPVQPDTLPIFQLTHLLYNLTHSLLAFGVIFLIMFLIFRWPRWSILGWLFNIIIDIPTHSYKFFPTPFLWPFSDWKFDGISWAAPWFMILNYSVLAVVWIILFLRQKKNQCLENSCPENSSRGGSSLFR